MDSQSDSPHFQYKITIKYCSLSHDVERKRIGIKMNHSFLIDFRYGSNAFTRLTYQILDLYIATKQQQ